MRCAATASSAAFRRATAGAGLRAAPLGVARGQPLVHERGGDAEAPLQALREAPGEPATGCSRAVGVRRQPDDEQHRPPLGDQALDRREASAVLRVGDGVQGMREAGFEIADGDADALGAEVEREDGARSRVRGDG